MLVATVALSTARRTAHLGDFKPFDERGVGEVQRAGQENGRYEIRVPAGTYTIEVWHERLGTKTQEVTVAAGGTATADVALDVPPR